MAYEWATQKERYASKLNIKSMGAPGGNAPRSIQIKTNHAQVTFVDVGSNEVALKETVTPSETTLARADGAVGAGDAYGLPWGPNFAAKIKLGQRQTKFVTPNLNGCAIFVGGGTSDPVVVHANVQPAGVIVADQPEFLKGGGVNPAFNSWVEKYKLPMWSDVYLTVLSKLVSLGEVPDNGLETLYPKDYLAGGITRACVWGVRSGSNWSLYVTEVGAQATSRKIWPS